MSTIFDLLHSKDKSEDYAIRGLLAIEKVRQSAAGQAIWHSTNFPPPPPTCLIKQNVNCVSIYERS